MSQVTVSITLALACTAICQDVDDAISGRVAIARPIPNPKLAAFATKGGTGDVATQAFEGRPLMGAAVNVGMQAKALGRDTALW